MDNKKRGTLHLGMTIHCCSYLNPFCCSLLVSFVTFVTFVPFVVKRNHNHYAAISSLRNSRTTRPALIAFEIRNR
jgi:hypothetical protein